MPITDPTKRRAYMQKFMQQKRAAAANPASQSREIKQLRAKDAQLLTKLQTLHSKMVELRAQRKELRAKIEALLHNHKGK